MGLSVSQNWDGASPLAGWVVDTKLQIAQLSPFSTPNDLVLTGGVGSHNYYATYGTGDQSGAANVTLAYDCLVRVTAGQGPVTAGVTFRASGTNLGTPSTFIYEVIAQNATASSPPSATATATIPST